MTLSRDEIKQIAHEAIGVDAADHASDHRYVRAKRLDEEQVRNMRRMVIQSGLIWAFPIALGFIALAVWREFIAYISAALK